MKPGWFDGPWKPANAIAATLDSHLHAAPYWRRLRSNLAADRRQGLRDKTALIVWHDRLLIGGKRARYWEY